MTASTRPDRAGWYEDPDQPGQLRYFDGILWTSHTSGRVAGTAVDSSEGPEPVSTPVDTTEGQPISPTILPPPPSRPGMPSSTGAWLGDPGKIVLAPLGARVLAYILDRILTSLLTVLLGFWFILKAVEPIRADLEATTARGDIAGALALIERADRGYLLAYAVIGLAVGLLYSVLFLVRAGATPGKLAVGIRVRRIDRDGHLDRDTAIKRSGFEAVLGAMGNAPYVGTLGVMLAIADLLLPFVDPRRQALHDKVAATVVVRRQG